LEQQNDVGASESEIAEFVSLGHVLAGGAGEGYSQLDTGVDLTGPSPGAVRGANAYEFGCGTAELVAPG
jgi:hypothetical protein